MAFRKRLAFCGEPYKEAVSTAALVREPVLCPPVTGWPWKGQDVTGHLLYFRLHGYRSQARWDGEALDGERVPALQPDDVTASDLTGCVVFAEVCHGATGADGAMRKAFLEAGASAFIGADATVWSTEGFFVKQAGLLGALTTVALMAGVDPFEALERAQALMATFAATFTEDDARNVRAFRVFGGNA